MTCFATKGIILQAQPAQVESLVFLDPFLHEFM